MLNGWQMKNLVLCFVSILVLCLSSGCARYWYNKDKTFTECKNDYIECRIGADMAIDNDDCLCSEKIRYEEKCMKAKGYRLISEGSLNSSARRRPADEIYGEKYGIAGKLEVDSQ